MARHSVTSTSIIAVMVVVSMALVGVTGIVIADQHQDGNEGNGEEIRSAEDNEDPQWPGNFTYKVDDGARQPGQQDVGVNLFSEGFTENFTIHTINVTSPHFSFEDCTAANTRAFGIDRGNDDPGTLTDDRLLDSYKSINYSEDHIVVEFYREQQTFGAGPTNISVYDQIVARSEGCYDNPEEAGWYRVYGQIFGSTNGDTETDHLEVDYSNWVWICDCENRTEAERTLGPAPDNSVEAYKAPAGGNGTGNGTSPTPTASTPPSPTASPTVSPTEGGDGDGDTLTPTETEITTFTETGTATGSPTATPTSGGDGDGDSGVKTRTPSPTDEGGPGFGAVLAVVALLAAAMLALRRR